MIRQSICALLLSYGTLRFNRSHLGYALNAQQNKARLHFKASLIATTRSVPKPKSDDLALLEFFSSDDHRNHLLIGRGNMRVTKLPKSYNTTRLFCRWKEESRFFDMTLPTVITNQKFTMLAVSTNFLIFSIIAEAILGVELFAPKRPSHNHIHLAETISPEYQFVLLEESFYADGPPPMVWLFNQITGVDNIVDKPAGDELKSHSSHVFFRVWTKETSNSTIAFTAQTKADISFNFPSVLLNLLPVSKDIIEKQGNAALKNSMEKDVLPGLEIGRAHV